MMDYKSLKIKYGPALAKQIRDEKMKFQEEKQPGDETIYWMKNPDTGDHSEAVFLSNVCKVLQESATFCQNTWTSFKGSEIDSTIRSMIL